MYPDEDLVPLSALQHFVFCRRQCALIHLEGAWAENRLTAEGRLLHDRVDQAGSESRRDLRSTTAVRICSRRLKVVGVMDMLEFHRVESPHGSEHRTIATKLPGASGLWLPFPVEYKRGRPKAHRADEIQLCAQACCLEEMLNLNIDQGALFYGQTRRRVDVTFDSELRRLTQVTSDSIHEMLKANITPPPVYGKWCESCSLIESCQPKLFAKRRSAKEWLQREMESALA
jgi:CRISPR-associated exonuclease Cas4